jgi:quinol monooxygenase YgiN
MQGMVAYVAHLVARPEAAHELERALEALVRTTSQEAGARVYVIHRLVDAPTRFIVYEAYADQAAGDAHMASAPVQAALARFGDLLAEPPVLQHVRAVDGFARAAGAFAAARP